VVKIKIQGQPSHEALQVLRAASLRALTPSTMNVKAVFADPSHLAP
jgi:hypothetical protein